MYELRVELTPEEKRHYEPDSTFADDLAYNLGKNESEYASSILDPTTSFDIQA